MLPQWRGLGVRDVAGKSLHHLHGVDVRVVAPHVGADLSVMERDSRRMRGDLPFVFTNLLTGDGLPAVAEWVERQLSRRSSGSDSVSVA